MKYIPNISHIKNSPDIVKKLMLQQFFEGFAPIMALYAIMFENVGGLDFQQIGLLFAIWSLSYLVAELPSGVLADYWSRKKVLVLGGVLRAIGFGLWLVWPSFWGYAIGFALWGFMIACSSGSASALLHDELTEVGQSKKYATYFGWTTSVYWLGSLVGYLIAAVLTLENTQLLIALSLISSLIFAGVMLTVTEHPYKKQGTYLKTLLTGIEEIKNSEKLRFISYSLFAVFMIIGVIEELLPRLYSEFGLNDTWVSLFLAISLVVTVIALPKLQEFLRFSYMIQILMMTFGVLLLIFGLYSGGVSGSVLLLVFSLLFHLFRPLFMHHIQDVATGEARATVGSIPGLGGGLLGAVAYVLIGKGAEIYSERVSVGLYGLFWLVILIILAFMAKKYRMPEKKDIELVETIDPIIQP